MKYSEFKAEVEQFDYEYLGYCDRSELERVIG